MAFSGCATVRQTHSYECKLGKDYYTANKDHKKQYCQICAHEGVAAAHDWYATVTAREQSEQYALKGRHSFLSKTALCHFSLQQKSLHEEKSRYPNCGNRLPHHITIFQDNCQRECKNGKILSAIVKLKLLATVDRVTLAYPFKGHTHGPLDATGGQACVKCSNSAFSSATGLVAIYDAWLWL